MPSVQSAQIECLVVDRIFTLEYRVTHFPSWFGNIVRKGISHLINQRNTLVFLGSKFYPRDPVACFFY